VTTRRWDPVYLIVTNSNGARCRHEAELAAGPAKRRILFIGCSAAAGDNVSNKDRFSDLLEGMVDAIESHNYALSGSGHDQQLLIHREFAASLDPDVLVLCPSLACIGRNLLADRLHYDAVTGGSIRVPRPYFTLTADGALQQHHNPVPKPTFRAHFDPRFSTAVPSRAGRVKDAIKTLMPQRPPEYLNHLYDDPQGAGYRLGHALLARILRESTAPVKLLAPLPDLNYAAHAEATNHHPFFSSVAAAGGAEFVDVAGFFRRLSERERSQGFFPHDGHYTRIGHEVIANGLAATLRSLGASRG
jgi:hypothetical protein